MSSELSSRERNILPQLQPRDILSPAATLLGFVLASFTFVLGFVEDQADLSRFITFLILAVILLVVAAILTVSANLLNKEILWRISMAFYAASWLFFGAMVILVLSRSLGIDPFKIQLPEPDIQLITAVLSVCMSLVSVLVSYYYGAKLFRRDLRSALAKYQDRISMESSRINETIEKAVLEEQEDKKMSFVKLAIEMERIIRQIAETKQVSLPYQGKRPLSIIQILNQMEKERIITNNFIEAFRSIWKVRNAVVHGQYVDSRDLNMALDLAATLLLELETIK